VKKRTARTAFVSPSLRRLHDEAMQDALADVEPEMFFGSLREMATDFAEDFVDFIKSLDLGGVLMIGFLIYVYIMIHCLALGPPRIPREYVVAALMTCGAILTAFSICALTRKFVRGIRMKRRRVEAVLKTPPGKIICDYISKRQSGINKKILGNVSNLIRLKVRIKRRIDEGELLLCQLRTQKVSPEIQSVLDEESKRVKKVLPRLADGRKRLRTVIANLYASVKSDEERLDLMKHNLNAYDLLIKSDSFLKNAEDDLERVEATISQTFARLPTEDAGERAERFGSHVINALLEEAAIASFAHGSALESDLTRLEATLTRIERSAPRAFLPGSESDDVDEALEAAVSEAERGAGELTATVH
jgi:hypothetical protein